jgi:GNAT superfamily N-acetyltransferase
VIVELPITKSNRLKVAQAFRSNQRVDLSIQCVIEGQMGKVYANHLDHPKAFLIEVSNFFWYFAGDASVLQEDQFITTTSANKLIMPSPVEWLENLQAMFVHRLLPMERFSFSSSTLSLEKINHLIHTFPNRAEVRRMDPDIIDHELRKPQSDLDLSEYDSGDDFYNRGIGYCLMELGDFVGLAYSSLVCSQGIEISIFVLPDYRRRGIATLLGCHLVKYCLENNLEPHWDAANIESCKLAEKLGYTPMGEYQAHFLTE